MNRSAIQTVDNLSGSADLDGGHPEFDSRATYAAVTKSRKTKRTPKAKRTMVNQRRSAKGERIRRGQSKADAHLSAAATSEEGHRLSGAQVDAASLATTCARLKDLQVQRRFLIRSKDRNRLALGSLIRRHLGWDADLPEKDRKDIAKKAAALMESALDKDKMGGVESWITELAFTCEQSCEPFDKSLSVVEKEMLSVIKDVPPTALEYVDSVKGFGRKTMAIIIGEAGDLNNYKNPGKLWKRLGLAPKSEYAMSDGGKHMVPRQRRSQVWACLGACLLRGNDGIYRAAYDRKKAEYLKRAETEEHWQFKGKPHVNHCHLAAHRYMEKLAVKHLWQAWRGHIQHEFHREIASPEIAE